MPGFTRKEEEPMLITRNGQSPFIHPSAVVASSAQIIGNVSLGEGCYIDYHVVIESSGIPIEIADHVMVLANSVLRSVGGIHRPPFPLRIEDHTLISPSCTLVGCQIGRNCYLATGVMVFQGAVIGEASRISAGAIVHLKTILPPQTRVGLRHIAVPTASGPLITADVEAAREQIAAADFFGTVFQAQEQEQDALQSRVMEQLLQEAFSWHDDAV
jgi:carbonic anhydrase/acetyltransferase-like protein (isoleucine patch superfamily)